MLVKQLKLHTQSTCFIKCWRFCGSHTYNITPEENITHIYFLPQPVKQVILNLWLGFLISLLVYSQLQWMLLWKLTVCHTTFFFTSIIVAHINRYRWFYLNYKEGYFFLCEHLKIHLLEHFLPVFNFKRLPRELTATLL